MMMVYTGILGIPESLFESAKLDGANYWKEVKLIILPLIRPTICMVIFHGSHVVLQDVRYGLDHDTGRTGIHVKDSADYDDSERVYLQ